MFIVTSLGKPTVIDLLPAPNAAEAPLETSISFVVPKTSNVISPSTAPEIVLGGTLGSIANYSIIIILQFLMVVFH